MRKPSALGTVLSGACVVLRGPQASAFMPSSLSSSLTAPRINSDGDYSFSRRKFPQSVMRNSMTDFRIEKDVVVIGGGLAGLSTALELAKRGRQVTVLSRSRAEAAAEAAGGMIAPQAERLESGVYLDLCLASRAMYPEWVSGIEAIAGRDGEVARAHLFSCGGFMSPAFDGDAVHVWNPPAEAGHAQWFDREQALEMEPSLSPEIVGAWWFPLDMSVDAQRMFRVLEQACTNSGVEILEGTSASGLVHDSGGSSVDAVLLEDGRKFHAKAYVSATGAWMRELMPVPMLPHKGQMMALRQPGGIRREGDAGAIGLRRVFFAEGCYIIPKRDGRVVVGSTVEIGEYGRHNTPAGIKHIIDAAIKVCPALGDLAIDRTWAGLRPSTPDTMPVLGPFPQCRNLFIAGGYWRNGVLLAPKAAQLVADTVCGCLPPQDEVFLRTFTVDRLITSDGQRTPAQAEPAVVSAATPAIQPPSAEAYSSELSQSDLLGMERAALEGSNDGGMFSGLEGLGTQATAIEEGVLKDNISLVEVDSAVPSAPREPVNDYDGSDRFSESSLKEARLANRLVQKGSDARLEALFGDGPDESSIPDANMVDMNVKAWEDGAEEVAKILGAKIVEVDIDIPEGMTEEEFLAKQGPILKVFLESPTGEDIEVPRGMNIGTMLEAGIIPPLGEDGYGVRVPTKGHGENAPGVFDPTAVKGASERNTEMSELYAKVIANKAKVRDSKEGAPEAGQGQRGLRKNAPSLAESPNSFVPKELKDALGRGESWLDSVLSTSEDSGDKGDDSGHSLHGATASGAQAGMQTVSETDTRKEGEGKEMVGYDFILQDRHDQEGNAARNARASTRDAPEGQDAWSKYEDIAREAIASFGETGSEDHIPP